VFFYCSQDYVDAFEKLVALNLKGRQERDLAYVIMHCCLKEKKFNPFYQHLSIRLCGVLKSLRYTFQFAFWDKLKELAGPDGPTSLQPATNIGRLVGGLVCHSTLSLAVLKICDFTQLPPPFKAAVSAVLDCVFAQDGADAVAATFKRIAGAEEYAALRAGLMFFMLNDYTSTQNLALVDAAGKAMQAKSGFAADFE